MPIRIWCTNRRNLLFIGGKGGTRTLDPGIMSALP
jgi:hypothetical protein